MPRLTLVPRPWRFSAPGSAGLHGVRGRGTVRSAVRGDRVQPFAGLHVRVAGRGRAPGAWSEQTQCGVRCGHGRGRVSVCATTADVPQRPCPAPWDPGPPVFSECETHPGEGRPWRPQRGSPSCWLAPLQRGCQLRGPGGTHEFSFLCALPCGRLGLGGHPGSRWGAGGLPSELGRGPSLGTGPSAWCWGALPHTLLDSLGAPARASWESPKGQACGQQ